MYRTKTLLGSTLKNRSDEGQKTEAILKCKILNHFAKPGLPKFAFQ